MPGPVGEVWGVRSQIGRESTPGVLVPATRVAYLEGVVLSDDQENQFHEFPTGTRDNVLEATSGPAEISGSFALPVSADELIEPLIITVNGTPTITTPAGGTNARDWSFVPGVPASASLELDDGARGWVGTGIRGNALRITGNVRERNMANFELFGQSLVAQALTGSLPSRTPPFFSGWETKIYIGAFGADPVGFTAVPGLLINWDINLPFNLGRKYTADNTQNASAITLGTIGSESTFTFEAIHAQALTQFTNHKNATKLSIRLEFGNNVVIEGALRKTVWIDLPGAWATKDLGGVDENTRTYEFTHRYVKDQVQGYGYRIICRNARTTSFGGT
jgi:hypothetical protein